MVEGWRLSFGGAGTQRRLWEGREREREREGGGGGGRRERENDIHIIRILKFSSSLCWVLGYFHARPSQHHL